MSSLSTKQRILREPSMSFEDKPNANNLISDDYQNEKENQNDMYRLIDELKETKSKLRIMTTKFQNTKKDLEKSKNENKEKEQEIMRLQNEMRHMIQGFSDTTITFPLGQELANIIHDWI